MSEHSIFGSALPVVPSGGDGASDITTGCEFVVDGDEWSVTGAKFWKNFIGGGFDLTFTLYSDASQFPSSPVQTKTVTLGSPEGWYSCAWDAPLAVADGENAIIAIHYPAAPSAYIAGALPSADPYQALDGSGLFIVGGNRGIFKDGAGGVTRTAAWYGMDIIAVQDIIVPLTTDVGPDRNIQVDGDVTLTAATANGAGTKTYDWDVSGGTGTFSAPAAASTDFMPDGPGTYVVSCTVTDDSATAYDAMALSVTVDPAIAVDVLPTAATAAGWALTPATGMTAVQILADSDGGTYLSSDGVGPISFTLAPLPEPVAGQDLIVDIDADNTAGLSSLSVALYEGATLISTVEVDVPDGNIEQPVASSLVALFPAADIADITDWSVGLTVRLTPVA